MSLLNSLCPHLKRKGEFFLRGANVPLVLFPLSNRRTIAHKYRELFERGIKGERLSFNQNRTVPAAIDKE